MAKAIKFQQGAYKEAVDYFRQKINLPTKRWNDLEGAMHTRAFTVAGAMREDILCDFRKAVESAIEKGDSLQDFRNNFYKIASKWRASDPSFDAKMKKPKYGAWRSKVIYQTNMLTAAAAAQERQAREMPDVFTHAKYVCMMLPGSREEHKRWNGTVLPLEDPWWEKHSPPNGFGCLCEKEFISKYEMDRGDEKVTRAPTAANDTRNIGENWDYSIASADMGSYMTMTQREELKKKKNDWIEIELNGEKSNTAKDNTPLPVIEDRIFSPDNSITKENFTDKMSEAIGLPKDKNAMVSIPFENQKTGFHYETIIKREHIEDFVDHITEGNKERQHRERLLPMFLETLKNPAEIRVQYLKSSGTNKRAIRTAFYNRFKVDGEEFMIEVVTNSGVFREFTIWTGYKNADKTRKGKCIFRRK
uniref:phage minor head protein n=1 Tax=uncultured Fibrobacter sp. TaxID=261512 RepID=UPI002633B39B|nr:phage minor head protein [uncultured Fibrobacter sp.]